MKNRILDVISSIADIIQISQFLVTFIDSIKTQIPPGFIEEIIKLIWLI